MAFDHYSEAGQEKSAAAHYELMPMEEIAALPVPQLWCCAPTLP